MILIALGWIRRSLKAFVAARMHRVASKIDRMHSRIEGLAGPIHKLEGLPGMVTSTVHDAEQKIQERLGELPKEVHDVLVGLKTELVGHIHDAREHVIEAKEHIRQLSQIQASKPPQEAAQGKKK